MAANGQQPDDAGVDVAGGRCRGVGHRAESAQRRQNSPGVPWNDPVVLGTLAMFGWLLLHVIIGAFYRPIRQGRKVAYLTLVSFIFLVSPWWECS